MCSLLHTRNKSTPSDRLRYEVFSRIWGFSLYESRTVHESEKYRGQTVVDDLTGVCESIATNCVSGGPSVGLF